MAYDELGKSITGERYRRCPQPEEIHRTHWSLVALRAAFSPVMRLQDVPRPTGWIWSTVVSLLTFVWSSMFLSLLALAGFTAAADFAVGAFVASRNKRYSDQTARTGIVGKGIGFLICILIFGAEFWAMQHLPQAPDTNGYVATFLLMCLWTVDVQSLDKHRRALGYGPIPGLSQALDWFRGMLSARIPPALPPAPAPAPIPDLELPPPEPPGVPGGALPSPAFDRKRAPNGGP